jgi:hypothetical protein
MFVGCFLEEYSACTKEEKLIFLILHWYSKALVQQVGEPDSIIQ